MSERYSCLTEYESQWGVKKCAFTKRGCTDCKLYVPHGHHRNSYDEAYRLTLEVFGGMPGGKEKLMEAMHNALRNTDTPQPTA